MRSGLKSVTIFEQDQQETARRPCAKRIFEWPLRCQRVDRLEGDVVAGFDEGERGGRRRRESVGQQVNEFAKVFRARAAEA